MLEREIHILFEGKPLHGGERWSDVVRRNLFAQWVPFNERDPDHRDMVSCTPCLVAAGLRFVEYGWAAITFGPYSWGPCAFCGQRGDESTMDPLSGGEQGCFGCIDNYLDRMAEELGRKPPTEKRK